MSLYRITDTRFEEATFSEQRVAERGELQSVLRDHVDAIAPDTMALATDQQEFDASYSRVPQWAKRHDKSGAVNYVAPDVDELSTELALVETWFNRVKGYKNQ